MKTHVLMLSKKFPATHPRHGEPTGFANKVISAIKQIAGEWWKLHTIRPNCTRWEKRIAEVQRGEAVLSIRIWSGAPYRSKQIEIVRLTKDDGVGIQQLRFHPDADGCILWQRFDIDGHYNNIINVANNDGLKYLDWRRWFRDYDLSKPLEIIHFTPFRY